MDFRGSGVVDTYLRSASVRRRAVRRRLHAARLAKWMLIGRWKPQQIRLWSFGTSASGPSRP